jgi:hypothetical protein
LNLSAAPTTLPGVPDVPTLPAVPGFGRKRRQLGGGFPGVDVPTVPAAPTVPASDSAAAAVSKAADAVSSTATTASGATETIDESKYKGLFEVGDCTKNFSFICIVFYHNLFISISL